MRWYMFIRRGRRAGVPLLMVFSLVIALVPSQLAFADANKLYITPSTSQMNINTTFTVNVRSYDDSCQSIGTANGTVTYQTNLLQVTGISTSPSDYGSPSISQGSGTIGFSASRNAGPSCTGQVFAITFRASGAGTATVGFLSNSQVNNVATTYGNGVYTILNPNPPPSSPSSTPKPSATPKPVPVVTTPVITEPPANSEPQPTPDPTGLIDNVVIDPLYTSSPITWKVNAPNPSATLSYGSSSSQLDKQASVSKKADGSFAATISGLTPGVRYYFAIAGSGDGAKSGSYSGTIITRGFPIVMTITENNIAVKNAQVKIGNRSYTTTPSGKLSIGLASGSYTGAITTDTATLTINVTVEAKTVPADGKAPPSQAFTYNLTSSPLAQAPGSEFSILSFIGILLGGTVVLGLGFVGFMAYRRRKFESGDESHTYSSPTVVIDDGYRWQPDKAAEPTAPVDPITLPTEPADMSSLPRHNNSVHITEQEPLDMFEQAKARDTTPSSVSSPSLSPTDETLQNPNSPHSTTP